MKYIALIGLILAWAVPAWADAKFDAMDTDKDKKVTWEEFQKAYPNMTRAAFDMIDTAQEGYISPEEWDVFMKSHRRSMSQEGQGERQAPSTPSMPSHGGAQPLITPPSVNK